MNEFSRDLWIHIWDSGVDVRRHIKSYYSDLKDCEIEPRGDLLIYGLAYALACLTGRLPDHLHNRMIFANNEWVKKYIELVGGN